MEPVFTVDTLRLSNWIATASKLETNHAHFVAADIPATRRRILEVSQGRCRFTIDDPGPFVQFRENGIGSPWEAHQQRPDGVEI